MTKAFSLSINRVIQALLIFLFVLNTSNALFQPLFAVFVAGSIVGATLKTVGLAIAIFAIVKSIAQVLLAREIDRRLEERDDFILMLIGGIFATLYPFLIIFAQDVWRLYALQVVLGIGDACILAAYYALFYRHTDRGQEAFEWSLFSVGGITISTGLGAFLGGFIADAFGFPMLFASSGMLALFATVILLLTYPHLKSKQKSSHS